MSEEEPQIIVDEGWKAKVQREKDEAAAKLAAKETAEADDSESKPEEAPSTAPEAEAPQPDAGADEEEAGAPTPFNELVASLAAQTMFALGVIAQEGQTEVTVNLDQARFAIDMLAMLREKTQGNLTPDEERSLREALGELQQIYVARVQQLQQQQMEEAGVDLNNLRGPGA